MEPRLSTLMQVCFECKDSIHFLSPGGLFPWSTSLNKFLCLRDKNSWKPVSSCTLGLSFILCSFTYLVQGFYGFSNMHTTSFLRTFSLLLSDSDILSAPIHMSSLANCCFERGLSWLSSPNQAPLNCFSIGLFTAIITGYKYILTFGIISLMSPSFIKV